MCADPSLKNISFSSHFYWPPKLSLARTLQLRSTSMKLSGDISWLVPRVISKSFRTQHHGYQTAPGQTFLGSSMAWRNSQKWQLFTITLLTKHKTLGRSLIRLTPKQKSCQEVSMRSLIPSKRWSSSRPSGWIKCCLQSRTGYVGSLANNLLSLPHLISPNAIRTPLAWLLWFSCSLQVQIQSRTSSGLQRRWIRRLSLFPWGKAKGLKPNN